MNAPHRKISRRAGGFTMVELLVGVAISSVVLAALGVSSVALQRSFEAANYRMTAQNDQLRVLDYVSRDLHQATKVTRANGGTKLTATLPAASSSTVTLDLGPLLGALTGSAAGTATTQTVSYYVEGGEFIRELDGAQTVLASTVAEVQFETTGAYLTTSVVFTPQFSNSPTTATQPVTRAESRVFLRNASEVN